MKKLVLLLLLSGCAMQQLQKPGATDAMRNADSSTCQYEADKATADLEDPILGGIREATIKDSCMQQRGWRWEAVK